MPHEREHITDISSLSEDDFYRIAFSRNIGIMTREEQEKLRGSRVAIAGCGGAGSISIASLPRIGIGRFNLTDLDTFGVENFNRQMNANVNTVGRPKVEVSRDVVKSINPFADVVLFPEGIHENNLDDFLTDVDVVVDALDFFSMDIRRHLYRKARERGIFILSSGPIGFGSLVYSIDPRGMSFDEYFDIRDGMDNAEMAVRFAIGILPSMLQRSYFSLKKVKFGEGKAPSLVHGSLLTGNLVATEVVKILLGRKVRPLPFVSQFDPYVQKYSKDRPRRGNRSFMQRLKIFVVLRKMNKNKKKSAAGGAAQA